MAVYALTSPDIYVGNFDLSSDCNAIAGKIDTNDLDVTTFGSGGWHARIAGLHDVSLDLDGFTNLGSSNSEQYLMSILGVANQVATIGETDGSQGSPALMLRTIELGHEQSLKVGDAATFKIPLKGSSVAVRGTMLWGKSTVTGTTTNGVYVSLGAVGATQYLYGTQHIFSFAGTSIVTVISSATNASGLGATTRLTFTSQSTASAEFAARVAGPITDTFWGASTTIVGATASITFAVAMGIQ
jgi:hypothetical protein